MSKSSFTTLNTTPSLQRAWSDDLLFKLRSSLEQQLDRLGSACGLGSLPVSREDLVGEVLLRLLAQDPQEIRAPFAYARTILRNLVRDKIRELERAQRVFEKIADAERSNAATEDEGTAGMEDGEFLSYLLDNTELSSLQRKVIQMVYFDGMRVSEVARVLAKNPGTIYRHHDRALQKLASCAAQLESER